jgi:hypothetical protein
MVNAVMIELYWGIGRTVPERQAAEPWGSGVPGRLAHDWKVEFPHMKGFNRRNLFYMQTSLWLGMVWCSIVQTPSAQLSWGHNVPRARDVDFAVNGVKHSG